MHNANKKAGKEEEFRNDAKPSRVKSSVTEATGPAETAKATDEQNRYANMLSVGRKVGLVSILVALGVYVLGVIPPKVPVGMLPQYWGLSSKEFMASTGLQSGWSWVGLYKYSDIMSYFGVAILGAVSAICYAAIIPGLLRKKDYAYVLIAVAEVFVLVLAASGIVRIDE
jgi:hypothetical protein